MATGAATTTGFSPCRWDAGEESIRAAKRHGKEGTGFENGKLPIPVKHTQPEDLKTSLTAVPLLVLIEASIHASTECPSLAREV